LALGGIPIAVILDSSPHAGDPTVSLNVIGILLFNDRQRHSRIRHDVLRVLRDGTYIDNRAARPIHTIRCHGPKGISRDIN